MTMWLAEYWQDYFCILVGINEGKRNVTTVGTRCLFTCNLGFQWKLHTLTVFEAVVNTLQHILLLALDYTGEHSPKHTAHQFLQPPLGFQRRQNKVCICIHRVHFTETRREWKNLHFSISHLYIPLSTHCYTESNDLIKEDGEEASV